MKKVYAKTIDPEIVDLYAYEDAFNDVHVMDGMNCDPIEDIKKAFDDYDMMFISSDYGYGGNVKAWVNDNFPDKDDKSEYTEEEAKEIEKLITNDVQFDDRIAKCLSFMHNEEYKHVEIKGCCQGDWAEIFLPAEYDDDHIRFLEAIYFSTGTEIEVHDGEKRPKDAEEVSGHCFYTHEIDKEGIKKAIAEESGCKPEDVMLYMFKGNKVIKMPEYELC